MGKSLRSIGYIRSNVLSKVVHMFGNNVTELEIDRGQQETKQTIKTKYSFIHYSIVKNETLSMNWSMWKHKTTYEMAGSAIAKLRDAHDVDDFLVKTVEISIQNKEVIQMFNKLQHSWAKGEGQAVLTKSPLSSNATIYVGFKSVIFRKEENKWVDKVNSDTAERLGFPYGTLDLYRLKTERKRIYNEREPELNWMLRDYDFAKIILGQLITDRWYATPRIQDIIDADGNIVSPIAIRTEEQTPSSTWKIIKDDEIRQ